MKEIEAKYNSKGAALGFLLVFLFWITIFYLIFPIYNNPKAFLILLASGCIMGAYFSIIMLFITRRKSIIISFINKEEFKKKINVILFKIGFIQNFNSDNFLSYRPSFKAGFASGNINIYLKETTAEIYGAKAHIKRIERLGL